MKTFFKVHKKKRRRGRHKQRRRVSWHHLQEWFWPSMGWGGFLRWVELKVKRSKGSAHSVAMGFALGTFVSFTPFIGLHLTLVTFLALILRGNVLVSALATFVGNPWTFPFIWVWIYKLGNFILEVENPPKLPIELNVTHVWGNLEFYWSHYIWPMTVGGVPTGIVAGVIVYYGVHANILSYRTARKAFLHERRQKRKKARLEKTMSVKDKIVEKLPSIKKQDEDGK